MYSLITSAQLSSHATDSAKKTSPNILLGFFESSSGTDDHQHHSYNLVTRQGWLKHTEHQSGK